MDVIYPAVELFYGVTFLVLGGFYLTRLKRMQCVQVELALRWIVFTLVGVLAVSVSVVSLIEPMDWLVGLEWYVSRALMVALVLSQVWHLKDVHGPTVVGRIMGVARYLASLLTLVLFLVGVFELFGKAWVDLSFALMCLGMSRFRSSLLENNSTMLMLLAAGAHGLMGIASSELFDSGYWTGHTFRVFESGLLFVLVVARPDSYVVQWHMQMGDGSEENGQFQTDIDRVLSVSDSFEGRDLSRKSLSLVISDLARLGGGEDESKRERSC